MDSPAGPPSYPEKFHYTERTKNSITLAWKPPRNDGGSPVIGYFVEKKRQDQQAFEPCNTEICPNMTMTVEGLDDAWMYEFRIKCANLIGESEPSIPLTVVIQDDEGIAVGFLPALSSKLFVSGVLTCADPRLSLSVAPEIHMLKHFKGDSIVVKKGDAIDLPADVLGLPIPKIEWSKDDVIIQKPTESLLMETETTGRMNCKTKLSIPSANRRDRGNYTVTASNNMGSAKHTISVMVLGELGRPPGQRSAKFCLQLTCALLQTALYRLAT